MPIVLDTQQSEILVSLLSFALENSRDHLRWWMQENDNDTKAVVEAVAKLCKKAGYAPILEEKDLTPKLPQNT